MEKQITVVVAIEILHSTQKSFADKDSKQVSYFEHTFLASELSDSVLTATSKLALSRGKHRAVVAISAKKESLKLTIREQVADKKAA